MPKYAFATNQGSWHQASKTDDLEAWSGLLIKIQQFMYIIILQTIDGCKSNRVRNSIISNTTSSIKKK